MSKSSINQRWLLARRPEGELTADNFEWAESPIPELQEGQVRVKTLYLSLDPTNRLWTNDEASYLPPVAVGEVMRGGGVGIVEASRSPAYQVGDYVQGVLNWQTCAVVEARNISAITVTNSVPITAYLGLFGAIGCTAYFGLMDVGKPKAGETLVVSAAAGAVGSLVGQIGKQQGCRVVGLAGSDDKCRWIVEELGFDAAINYKTEDIAESLRGYCPDGIDIYFDNVGGEILEAALELLNNGARIPLCGMISQYNLGKEARGPRNLMKLLTQRATMQGFIVLDYLSRSRESDAYLAKGLEQGTIAYRVDVVEGLQQAPEALNMLFLGKNQGKLIVNVGDC